MISRFGEKETLRLYFDGIELFVSEGKWLHPLFDLGRHLDSLEIDRSRLYLVDRVTGKAAALLVQRMGIRSLYSGVLSRLAASALERAGIGYRCSILVDRIDCRTESLLETIDDTEEAYRILAARVGLGA